MIELFLERITLWADTCVDIVGVALVGSYVRGTPKATSDIDLILLVQQPQVFILETDWAKTFGKVSRVTTEDWGEVTSLRVWYENPKEVEFSFTTPNWASIPVDPGTARVVSDGLRILYDPSSLLAKLMAEINNSSR